MYPFFEVFSWIYIYTFWLTLVISFFAFLWMLKRLSHRFWINTTFFFNRIIWYFLSVFIFSRLFYVISNWNEFRFIGKPLEFFLMSDYNFSLMGAIFWFLLVLFISIILHWLRSWKYMDVSVLSLLFVLPIWYIWTLLWGQVYWKETHFWIEILYTNVFSPVPYQVPVFPLPIVYALVFFLLFSALYMISMFVKVRWIIGYIWIIIFSSIILYLETFSWRYDFFRISLWFNFTQICAVVLIIFWFFGLYRIYKNPQKQSWIE